MPEIKIRDIKPIVDVPDHSIWLFFGLVFAGIALLTLLVFWLVQRKRAGINRKRAEALRRLKGIDLNDTKQAVYDFTLLAHYAVTLKMKPELKALLEALEMYKFKKEVPPLDKELKRRLNKFIQEVRHG